MESRLQCMVSLTAWCHSVHGVTQGMVSVVGVHGASHVNTVTQCTVLAM